jgi:propanediol dehydratase large subunit
MTHFTILRRLQLERRELVARAEERSRLAAERAAREQQRVASLQNQWAQVTAARANAALAGFQQKEYSQSVQKLVTLAGLIKT